MASKKLFTRIGVLLLLIVFLLGTSVSAKRPLVAAPNGDIGVKEAKIDPQWSWDDSPWENGGSGSTYPPGIGQRNTNIKT